MLKRKRNLLAAFLPCIFVWYIGCISLFPHTHITQGGSIVHSHPCSDAEHSTDEETLGIELMCNFNRDLSRDGIFLPKAAELKNDSETWGYQNPYLSRYFAFSDGLRAPPFA